MKKAIPQISYKQKSSSVSSCFHQTFYSFILKNQMKMGIARISYKQKPSSVSSCFHQTFYSFILKNQMKKGIAPISYNHKSSSSMLIYRPDSTRETLYSAFKLPPPPPPGGNRACEHLFSLL